MKKTSLLPSLTLIITWAIIAYLCESFVFTTLDFRKWGGGLARAVFVLNGIVCPIFVAYIRYDTSDNKLPQ